jgi:hypothetical protein
MHYDCWWNGKTEGKEEPKAATYYDVLATALTSITSIGSIIIKLFIKAITYESLFIAITGIVIYIAIKTVANWLYKGRPNINESLPVGNTTQAKATISAVTASTNIHFDNPRQFEQIQKAETEKTFIINAMSKPNKFEEGMNIRAWLIQLESYLRQFDKQYWATIATSFISEKSFATLGLESNFNNAEVSNEYEKLKEKLLKVYAIKENETKNLSLSAYSNYSQNIDESAEDYGERLIRIAQQALPKASLDILDDMLKQQFIRGLRNPRLRQKLAWKTSKIQDINQQSITMQELILHAKLLERSYALETTSTEYSCNEDDRKQLQICAINQLEQKPSYLNTQPNVNRAANPIYNTNEPIISNNHNLHYDNSFENRRNFNRRFRRFNNQARQINQNNIEQQVYNNPRHQNNLQLNNNNQHYQQLINNQQNLAEIQQANQVYGYSNQQNFAPKQQMQQNNYYPNQINSLNNSIQQNRQQVQNNQAESQNNNQMLNQQHNYISTPYYQQQSNQNYMNRRQQNNHLNNNHSQPNNPTFENQVEQNGWQATPNIHQ